MRETGWRRTRLKYLASAEAGTWGEEPGEAGEDIYCIRAADFDRQRLRVAQDRIPVRSVEPGALVRLALRPGDIVLEKSGGGPDQPVGGSVLFDLDISAVCSNFAARLRPAAGVDPRFLNYLMASMYHRGVTASLAKQTTGIANLDMGAYMACACVVPCGEEQGAIAAYLDAETARIDRVVEALEQRARLLDTRKRAAASTALNSVATATVALRRVVDLVTSGPRGWSDLVVDSGTKLFLRIANVPRDSIELRLGDVAFIEPPLAAEADRCRVRPGDVLTTITAAIGQVAVVPAGLGEAYVSQHLALIRPVSSRVLPEWLALALWTDDAQRQLDAARYGGTKQQLALDDVREVRIPWAPLPQQRQAVGPALHDLSTVTEASARTRRAIDLMQDRREALITAAVTGQIGIPGVAA